MFTQFRKSMFGTNDDTEVCEVFRSFAEWEAFQHKHEHLFKPETIERYAAYITESGAIEPITKTTILPEKLEFTKSFREGLAYSGINSRGRAVMLAMDSVISDQHLNFPKIYATEAVTPFALRLRGRFIKFIGSEYAETPEQISDLFPIPSEDLLNLSFSDNVFDIVTTNEVLEHVPSIDGALTEIHRVLKKDGWHIGTVPFCYGQSESIVRAQIVNGELVHLTEPEFHGNPVDTRGSLVFELPGWNILERARHIGFSDAHMKFILSTKHGCLSENVAGIFVLCLQK